MLPAVRTPSVSPCTLYRNEIPNDWDVYLRRAEANHALKPARGRPRSITRRLSGSIRRRRSLVPAGPSLQRTQALRCCAARFSKKAIPLVTDVSPSGTTTWTAELYSLQSGVYAGCPEHGHLPSSTCTGYGPSARLIPFRRVRPSSNILAAAHASAGDFAKAVAAQKQALASGRDSPSRGASHRPTPKLENLTSGLLRLKQPPR